ncbi:prophage protein [Lactococcus lactis subsp. lactis]|uniref:Prophage protein n=2 Tax=Lactococcus lactis TaxID=1358 RepID=A0A2A5S7B4_LACLH|nr:prophage protein [Lactococcus lactis subsp. lactis]PCS09363.1 hypothetical protein RU90_GL002130 [Lactococcus lactis subsp. hordniae]
MTKATIVKMPNTKQFEFGGLNLQLRLDGKSILNIEKRLDEALLGIFTKGQGEMKMPAQINYLSSCKVLTKQAVYLIQIL